MVAGVVRQWGRIANFLFEVGRVRTPTALVPRKAARSAAWRANAPPLRSIQTPGTSHVPWRRTQRTTPARAGAYAIRTLRRSRRPHSSRSPDHGPARQPVHSRRSPVRVARSRTISRWTLPPRDYDRDFSSGTKHEQTNCNRRRPSFRRRNSQRTCGAPLPVVSISGTKTRSRLRSRPAGSDEDWFPDLSNSKKILFRDVK